MGPLRRRSGSDQARYGTGSIPNGNSNSPTGKCTALNYSVARVIRERLSINYKLKQPRRRSIPNVKGFIVSIITDDQWQRSYQSFSHFQVLIRSLSLSIYNFFVRFVYKGLIFNCKGLRFKLISLESKLWANFECNVELNFIHMVSEYLFFLFLVNLQRLIRRKMSKWSIFGCRYWKV